MGAFLIAVAADATPWAGTPMGAADSRTRARMIAGGDGYVNAISDDKVERVRSSYGAGKYGRLAGIKAEYDPDNVFHLNANIHPARPAAAGSPR
jgi:FAD/FMN-containing dehydrogenase